MAGILNKVKDLVGGESTTQDNTTTRREGALGDNYSGDNYSNTGSHVGSTNEYGSNTSGEGFTSSNTQHVSGPHNSKVANELDPRVDSDRDGSRTAGNTNYGSSNYGSSTNTAGPHNSNIANELDPRVDSDRDGSRTAGNTNYGSSTGNVGHGSVGGFESGNPGASDNFNDYTSTGTGTHHHQHNTGTTGGILGSSTSGQNYESDRDGSRTLGNSGDYSSSGTTGLGSSTHGSGFTTGTGGDYSNRGDYNDQKATHHTGHTQPTTDYSNTYTPHDNSSTSAGGEIIHEGPAITGRPEGRDVFIAHDGPGTTGRPEGKDVTNTAGASGAATATHKKGLLEKITGHHKE